MMRLLKVEVRGPWGERRLPMELLLLVAGSALGMIQIGSYRDRGIEYENESGVASRILRNRSILGRLYMGLGVRGWKYWGSEVVDLMLLEVWLLARMAGRAMPGVVQVWW
jgi:hypothetical protein